MDPEATAAQPDPNDPFSDATNQQTAIGWRQLFNGRLSSEWTTMQDQHLANQHNRIEQRTGTTWATGVITVLWKQWFILWETRNGIVHGHDDETRKIKDREKAEKDIHRIYKHRKTYLPRDDDLLFSTAEIHIEGSSTTALQNWLLTHSTTFLQSAKKAKTRATLNTLSIMRYFGLPEHHPG